MTIEQQEIIALLIIRAGHSNSHGLVKVLTWKFKLMNFLEIIENIKHKGFIFSDYNQGLGLFSLTDLGKEVINSNENTIISILKQEFPDQLTYIESLNKTFR